MLLLAHVATGAVISQSISNPLLVSLVAFGSHCVLDSLPHWNYEVPKKITWREFAKIAPDILPSIIIYTAFIALYPEKWSLITLGVGFAILPDFLFLSSLIPPFAKFFKLFNDFHGKIQSHADSHEIFLGIASQIIY